jgi:monovalent cation:H+ antiporter-2, CPA2 family
MTLQGKQREISDRMKSRRWSRLLSTQMDPATMMGLLVTVASVCIVSHCHLTMIQAFSSRTNTPLPVAHSHQSLSSIRSLHKCLNINSPPQQQQQQQQQCWKMHFSQQRSVTTTTARYQGSQSDVIIDAEWVNTGGVATDSKQQQQQQQQYQQSLSHSPPPFLLRQRLNQHCQQVWMSIKRCKKGISGRLDALFRSKTRYLMMTAAMAAIVVFGQANHHSTNIVSHAVATTISSTTTTTTANTVIERVSSSSLTSSASPMSQSSTMLLAHRGGAGSTTTGRTSTGAKSISVDKDVEAFEKVVERGILLAEQETSRTFAEAFHHLAEYIHGPKSDTLLLLLATALITPICKRLGTSPILGFLASGMLLGPNAFGLISGIHTTETLAELGIVFFLFEMGIELSIERLLSMKKDVFGLGLSQFAVTACVVAAVGGLLGLPSNAMVVLGGGLALSSSAFVLQILKDKNQLATRFGRASFGILLFQDLAVVPLLVVTPILAGGSGKSLVTALGSAVIKAGMALGAIALAGRVMLNPLFKMVAQAQSQEAFLGLILLTVLSMSFLTEGLGLSNTLGAFLAGVLLSETKYRYQVEADIAPFRGILLGLFFVTVGFEIDLGLIASKLPQVSSIVLAILVIKAAVTTALSLAFGLSLSVSQQTGLILSQGGEFAFVAFALARSLGILDSATTKLLLTTVSLTMALTPLMASVGDKIAKKLEEKSDFTHYLGQDRVANEIKQSDGFVVVVGYGIVGRVVCDLLDRKFIRYVGIDIDPNKAIRARNAGLPVFYGDIGRQEVAEAFNVGKAKAVVVCISDKSQANRVVIALRRWYPDLKIFARAVNADHAERLQNTLNVAAMVPILPEDNLLLTLPFASAVMKSLGVPGEEVNAITAAKRKEVLIGRALEEDAETAALYQLGVSVSQQDDADESIATGGELDKAAAERRQGLKGKSPFVAEVIEEVCPASAIDSNQQEMAAELTPEVDVPIAVNVELMNVDSIIVNASGSKGTSIMEPEPEPVSK